MFAALGLYLLVPPAIGHAFDYVPGRSYQEQGGGSLFIVHFAQVNKNEVEHELETNNVRTVGLVSLIWVGVAHQLVP